MVPWRQGLIASRVAGGRFRVGALAVAGGIDPRRRLA
jgi:hypothetical protein